MTKTCVTIKIKSGNKKGFRIINKKDYDPRVHETFIEEAPMPTEDDLVMEELGKETHLIEECARFDIDPQLFDYEDDELIDYAKSIGVKVDGKSITEIRSDIQIFEDAIDEANYEDDIAEELSKQGIEIDNMESVDKLDDESDAIDVDLNDKE